MGKASKHKQRRNRAAPPPRPEIVAPPPLRAEVAALSGVTFLLALLGYAFTFARTVTLVDSGELILACKELGVAHPPGFPLYTLAGHLFTLFPVGSVAARVAFFSAFFAAVSAALVTVLAVFAGSSISGAEDRGSERPFDPASLGPRLAPVAVGLTFAFSVTLWFYASVAEVYTIHIALMAAVLCLMFAWRRRILDPAARLPPTVPLMAAAFLFGLALGVHHVTILLTLPALAVFVLATSGWRFYRSRDFGLAFVAALAGLSIYAYLPLAARAQPILNWGNPSTLQRFFWHISARQYQVNLFSANADAVAEQLRTFARWAFGQFTPLGLAGALAGLVVLWRRQRAVFWLVALMIVCDVAYTVNYDIAEDRDAYYLTSYLAMAIALGAAAGPLFRTARVRASRRAASAALVLLLVLPAGSYALHRFENDRSRFPIARHFVEDALAAVPRGGLLLTEDWQFYSPFLYLRHVEGFRPDAEVVDVNLVRRSWYVRTYLDRQYPAMMRACSRQEQDFLADLERWEQKRPFDAERLTVRFHALLNAFVDYHVRRDAALRMPPLQEPGVGTSYFGVPEGLAIELFPDKAFRPEQPIALHVRDFDGSVFLDEVARGKVRRTYAEMIGLRGRYLALFGRDEEGARRIETAIQLDPDFDRLYEFLGDVRAAQRRPAEAADAYREALRINPENAAARQGLAALSSGPPLPTAN